MGLDIVIYTVNAWMPGQSGSSSRTQKELRVPVADRHRAQGVTSIEYPQNILRKAGWRLRGILLQETWRRPTSSRPFCRARECA